MGADNVAVYSTEGSAFVIHSARFALPSAERFVFCCILTRARRAREATPASDERDAGSGCDVGGCDVGGCGSSVGGGSVGGGSVGEPASEPAGAWGSSALMGAAASRSVITGRPEEAC